MIGHLKPGSLNFLDSSNFSVDSRLRSTRRVDLGMFLDTGDVQDVDQSQRRTVSAPSSSNQPPESAAMTFEDSVFESRIVCLRQIMKCIVSAELAGDPMRPIESIHQKQSTMVLEIVQVFLLVFCDGWDCFYAEPVLVSAIYSSESCRRMRIRLLKACASPREPYVAHLPEHVSHIDTF